ncbi:MAG: DNA repair exonuclease [Clostridia bacterium]|nr:DNA repair exonuclease [Clostridia bacterium]
MRFVHIADTHLDINFKNLSSIDGLPEKRRLEQRKIMKDIIEYIKTNNIQFLFISGDLYEQQYIRKSSIQYINRLFNEIPNVKIFISPGNHDPFIKNSFYNTFQWSSNVHIFKNNIEKVEIGDINIYGYGFNDYYCKESNIENIEIENKDKINILVAHGSVDGGNDEYREYNPMSSKKLKTLGFDYIALGHIHKKTYNDEKNQRIVYPGSTISFGFDELGEHGMVVGDIDKENLNLEFVKLDSREYKEFNLDISECVSNEDILEKIEEINFNENNLYKIILIGNRNFIIDTIEIKKLLSKDNIIKIKDNTKVAYNINDIILKNDIKGIFAKKVMEKYESGLIDKETMEKVIETGLEVL